jgi:hypothetical protein
MLDAMRVIKERLRKRSAAKRTRPRSSALLEYAHSIDRRRLDKVKGPTIRAEVVAAPLE